MKLNGNGSEYETIIPRRLNEGITELMTVHILDQKTRGVSYPIEARVAATIEFIATDDRVFRAYFSGDWIEVQKQVNTKLRPFAFDRMLILMANEDPGNMRAGEYEDPYACLPLEYLGNLIAEKRGLKREFFRTKNREIVWRRSEDMCR